MKVYFVLDTLTQGGSERQMIRTAGFLRREGFDCRILLYGGDSFYASFAEESGIEVQRLGSSRILPRIWKLRRIVGREKPAYLVSLVGHQGLYALAAAAFHPKTAVVLSWRFYADYAFRGLTGLFTRLFAGKIRYLVCNSYAGEARWKQERPKDAEKLRTIYNLVDEALFTLPAKPSRAEDGRVRIVILARVQEVKNAANLVEAVAMLPESERKKLEIVWYGNASGDGSYREAVKKRTDELSVSDTVRFENAVTDVPAVLETADIVALFSHSEGFPNAICEGMMAGKAILMTPVSDCRKMVGADNGYLLPDGSVEEIAKALSWAASADRSGLAEMGEHSREKARALFDNRANMQKWVALFGET